MRTKAFFVGLLPLSLAALGAAGCGGLGGELTTLVCECEHCDDWREDKLIASLDASREVAAIYECDVEWESLVQCEIDEGTCDDEEARWSVSEPGSCSSSMDLGTMCTSDAQCSIIPNATCSTTTMTCQQRVCAGGGSTCSKDSDCTAGEYKCADELKDLVECEDDAADDKSYIGFGAGDD
jgi:hypothetical protein